MFRLKEIRKKKSMSQQELADYLGVTQATLSGWENEKYEIDNASLLKCADYFQINKLFPVCILIIFMLLSTTF